MASSTGQPRVWSLWIYDRHCTLIYHADWSSFHSRNIDPANARAGAHRTGSSATLPLAEQAKLVYGLVFSLRNMTRKLSPQQAGEAKSGGAAAPEPAATASTETLHNFSTSTYTLAHLHTPTKYTFVMLTDPVAPPTRRAPAVSGGTAAATFSGGGGIPATGGMTTTGVLLQISRGPWVEFVARNAACLSLERQEDDDDDDDDDDDEEGQNGSTLLGQTSEQDSQERHRRREQRRQARQAEITKQRMSGLGKSVDSEAFRASVERVLAQNKLNAPRM